MISPVKKIVTILFLIVMGFQAQAQQMYQYSVDLTKLTDDKLVVDLVAPAITQKEIHFYLPKIVPGTYMNSNYGKYVQNLQAFNKAGKALPVEKYGDNGWTIKMQTVFTNSPTQLRTAGMQRSIIKCIQCAEPALKPVKILS